MKFPCRSRLARGPKQRLASATKPVPQDKSRSATIPHSSNFGLLFQPSHGLDAHGTEPFAAATIGVPVMATLFCCPATGPVEKTAVTCRHLSSLGSWMGMLDKGPRRLGKLRRKQRQPPESINPIRIHARQC